MNKEQIQQKFDEILEKHDYKFYFIGSDEVLDDRYLTKNDLLELMEFTFNLGLDVAADNTEADVNIVSTDSGDYSEVYVLKESILKHKL